MDFITPHQFAIIEDGVFRGSYPTLRHFCFLERLNLKTIVSLTPEPPTQDLQDFCQLLGIRTIHFQINRLTPISNPNLQKKLVQAVSAIIAETAPSGDNKANPKKNVFVHCLDGRRITGLMVLLLRRLQNYAPAFSYSEYWKFQLDANMPIQEELRVNRDFDRFVNEVNEEFILPSDGLPRYLWDGESYKVFPSGLKVSYSAISDENSSDSQTIIDTSSLPPTSGLSSIPSSSQATYTHSQKDGENNLANMYDRLSKTGNSNSHPNIPPLEQRNSKDELRKGNTDDTSKRINIIADMKKKENDNLASSI